jgi:hypothetical protein
LERGGDSSILRGIEPSLFDAVIVGLRNAGTQMFDATRMAL